MPLSLTVRRASASRPFTVTIDVEEATIGRASTCDLRLPFPVISSHHLTVRRIDGEWQVIDVGSTNGTTVQGMKLPADRPVEVRDGMELRIVDVTIEFNVDRDPGNGFTLAQTGTMVRQMISDALRRDHDDEDLALFEVLSGPGAGRRATIPDELDEGWIGSAREGVLLGIQDRTVPKRAVRVHRHDDGFVLAPVDQATVLLDGEALRGPARLRSNARIVLGTVELVFFDPLESYLDELEGLRALPEACGRPVQLGDSSEVSMAAGGPGALAAGRGRQPGIPSRDEDVGQSPRESGSDEIAGDDAGTDAGVSERKAPRRLGAIEVVLLVASAVILLLGIALVLIFVDLL